MGGPRTLAAIGDHRGARMAVDDAQALVERLYGLEATDMWFGYPGQKHFVHLSQADTLLGDTNAAYSAQDDALDVTDSPSVMTRALIAMDTAACLRLGGDPASAAEIAAGVFDRHPATYRDGLIRSRAKSFTKPSPDRDRPLRTAESASNLGWPTLRPGYWGLSVASATVNDMTATIETEPDSLVAALRLPVWNALAERAVGVQVNVALARFS
ncbi:hypothetical protein [Streptomyces sp. NPDC001933]|uniref:hypothetical protein n=1 Tax=Streptomyces sp. NPDC001933 TaxID=3364626 RepID=UPI0036AF7FB9